MDSLTNKQFEKISFVLDLIEQIDIVPRKYFKKLKDTDDIWEVRVQHGNNVFRTEQRAQSPLLAAGLASE